MKYIFPLIWFSLNAISQSVSPKQLQGAWACIGGVDYIMLADAYENPYSGASHLFFKNDTLYSLDYPCQIVSVMRYKLHKDSLVQIPSSKTSSPTETLPGTISLQSDTLIMEVVQGLGYKSVGAFVRFQFDQTLFNKLKKYQANSNCSEGKWKLIRDDHGDDGSLSHYTYPFQVPDSLTISKADIKAGSTVLIPVNGKNKPCRIEYYKRRNSGQRMNLSPIGWCKDKTIRIHYKKIETTDN